MSDIYNTLSGLNTLFWRQTMIALGYDPDDYNDPDNLPSSMPVRQSWPTDGQPAWLISEDVCFLRVIEQDSPINRQRHVTYETITSDIDNDLKTVGQTRVLNVSWIFYGPNSWDNAFKVKNALFDDLKEDLNTANVYLIPNIASPRRFPEIYMGQWWERVDFDASFNEKIVLETKVPLIKSAVLKIIEESGDETNVVIEP